MHHFFTPLVATHLASVAVANADQPPLKCNQTYHQAFKLADVDPKDGQVTFMEYGRRHKISAEAAKLVGETRGVTSPMNLSEFSWLPLTAMEASFCENDTNGDGIIVSSEHPHWHTEMCLEEWEYHVAWDQSSLLVSNVTLVTVGGRPVILQNSSTTSQNVTQCALTAERDFLVVAVHVSWYDAFEYCSRTTLADGSPGSLVTLRTEDHAEHFKEQILPVIASLFLPEEEHDGTWLGGSDIDHRGVWSWTGDDKVFYEGQYPEHPERPRVQQGYTNWLPGYPSFLGDTLSDTPPRCLSATYRLHHAPADSERNMMWDDKECKSKQRFVCEYCPEAVAPPSQQQLSPTFPLSLAECHRLLLARAAGQPTAPAIPGTCDAVFKECDRDGDIQRLTALEAESCGFEAAIDPTLVQSHALSDVSPKDGYISRIEYAVRHSMSPEHVRNLVFQHNDSITLIGHGHEPLTTVEQIFDDLDKMNTGKACCISMVEGMNLEQLETFLATDSDAHRILISGNTLNRSTAASTLRVFAITTSMFALVALVAFVIVMLVRRSRKTISDSATYLHS